MQFSLSTNTPEELLSLDTGGSPTPTSPELADLRARKAEIGLADFGKKYQDYYNEFIGGNEQHVRKQTVENTLARNSLARQEIIMELAKRKGGALTPQDLSDVDWMITPNVSPNYDNPDNVLEQYYAKAYTSYLDYNKPGNENTFLQDAYEQMPKTVEGYKEVGREAAAKYEFFKKIVEDAEENFKGQSWPSFGVDLAKMLVPGYYETKQRGHTDNTNFFYGPLGANVEEQRKDFYRMPINEMTTKFKAIYDKLKEDNPYVALQYARAMLGKSADELGLDNLFSMVDIATGMQGVKALLPLRTASQKAVKDAVEGVLKGDPSLATIAGAAGDVGEAAVQQAAKTWADRLGGSSKTLKNNLQQMFSFYKLDINDLWKGATDSTRELTTRLVDQTVAHMERLGQAAAEITRVSRVPELEAATEAMRALKENIKDLYPGLSNKVLDVSNLRHDPASNTYHLDMILGKNSGEIFDRHTTASQMARALNLPKGSFDIIQYGRGFAIRITKPLDETQDLVRNLLTKTRETADPEGGLLNFFHWIRTPEETLSLSERMQRKTASYTPSWLMQIAQEESRFIKQLYKGTIKTDPVTGAPIENLLFGVKNRWNEWNSIVKLARTAPNPKTGKPGYFFENITELENAYRLHIHRPPDEAEVQAYFAYKRLMEMDRVLRNAAVYRNKARVGTEVHRPILFSAPGQETVYGPVFEGILRRTMPGTKDTILILGKEAGKETMYRGGRISPKVLKKLEEGIANGTKTIIEIFDPESRPFFGFGKVKNERPRYVVMDKVETKPLDWEQVPRQGGGHWEFDYPFYIKQAKVRAENIRGEFRHWYEGDTTIMPMSIRAAGRDVAKHLDKVRQLLAEDKIKEAKNYSQANLPIDWKEVRSWFRAHKVNGQTIPARLSKYEPIQLIGQGETIGGVDGALRGRYTRIADTGEHISTFVDGTKHGSAARQQQVEFTGPRDSYELMTLEAKGSKNNPLFDYEPAKMIDPIPSLDRALSKIINSTFMDDYKIGAVEHWLAKAVNHLESTVPEIRGAPFWHFLNPTYKKDTPFAVEQQLKATHWQIEQFLGQQNVIDNFIDQVAQTLADGVYNKGLRRAMVVDPIWALGKVKDAPQFMRSVAFNAKLGLFAVPQLLVQMQTYSVIAGVAGLDHAALGSAGAYMTLMSRINKNPAIIDKLDEALSKLKLTGTKSWKRGEFKESLEEMRKTGFGNVQGEFAMLDAQLSPRVFRSPWGDFLHAGQAFFRGGEKAVRWGAWHTAYKEFRNANPIGRITEAERKQILDRADMYSVNMSRASNSALHSGFMSLPTQFLTYQLRLAELFWGKRLNNIQRARLAMAQSMFYGVPVGTGVTGMPLADSIRQYAQENGYVVGDNWITSTLMEGIPAALAALGTGRWLNVGDRLGSQGFEIIREVLNGDRKWYEILMGVAGSTIGGFYSGTDGFRKAIVSMFKDDGKSFPIKTADIIDMFKEISSVNNSYRALAAMNTGIYLSKKDLPLERNVGAKEAIAMALTGLQPVSVPDAHNKTQILKTRNELEKDGARRFTIEWQRGIRAEAQGRGEGSEYFTRAINSLKVSGIPQTKWPEIVRKGTMEYRTLVEQIDWSFYAGESVPDEKRQILRDAYGTTLRQQRGNK